MSENTERTFCQEFVREAAKESVGKAIMWVPAIAAGLMLGPVGIFLGRAASVGIIKILCSSKD
jgi:hypothetical protein